MDDTNDDTNGVHIKIDRKAENNEAVVYCCGDRVSQWLQKLFPCIKELIGVSVSCKLVLESSDNPNTCDGQLEENSLVCSEIANVFQKLHSSGCIQPQAKEGDENKDDGVGPSIGDKNSRYVNVSYSWL